MKKSRLDTKCDYCFGIESISDYGWNIKPFKKVILVNPKDCDKISFFSMLDVWGGTGHREWEYLLAAWFVDAVVTSLKNGEKESDISILFDKDFLASDNRIFRQNKVHNHILPYFQIISNTDNELRLAYKTGGLI